MSKHTPGPWLHVLDHNIYGRPGNLYVWTSDGPGHGLIGHTTCGPVPEEEAIANARLIAAAPLLLEACEAIINRLDYLRKLWGDEGVTRSLCDQVRAATIKATEDPADV